MVIPQADLFQATLQCVRRPVIASCSKLGLHRLHLLLISCASNSIASITLLPSSRLPPGPSVARCSWHLAPCVICASVSCPNFLPAAAHSSLQAVKPLLPSNVPIICVSKGLEVASGAMMSEVLTSALERKQPAVFLSGPSFAQEVMQKRPTGAGCVFPVPHCCPTLFASVYASPASRGLSAALAEAQ